MRHPAIIISLLLSLSNFVYASDESRLTPEISLQPLEVDPLACFDLADWFHHPAEVTPPAYQYPADMLSHCAAGEVAVLIQIGEDGNPRYLRALLTTNPAFAKAAVEALKKTRWGSSMNGFRKRDVWFIYRVLYTVDADDKPIINDGRQPNLPPRGTPEKAPTPTTASEQKSSASDLK